MTTPRTLIMLLAAGLGAAALPACGPAVPEHPSWVADVRPIMVARCVRCHGAQAEGDPLSLGGQKAVGNFSHQSLSDFSDDDLTVIKLSNVWIQKAPPPEVVRMPPAPAAELADWQVETIDNWLKDLP